uniref:ETS domain-containing protein n=1 Tax=Steinernema glaseri TaxID=37863 RepID=A0A1I7ZDM9_9BILA
MSSNVPPSMGSNAPQPMSSNVLPSTSSNVPPSTSSDVPSFADVIKGEGPGPISRPPPKKTQNGGIPRESPFDNGAERKAPKESPPKASAPSFPGPFPAGSGVLSLSDLETRIITDSNVINRGTPPPNFAQQHRGGPLPPELAQKMAAAHAAMNRPPPLPFAHAAMNRPPPLPFGMAPGHGRVPWIPGVPLMPPGMHMPPPRYPPFGVPPGALPPKNYPQPPPHHLPPNNSRHHQSFNQQYQSSNFDQMSVASDHSRGSAHRQKKPGMPSSRTISDYAFDPYAGFMSRKEREWLIRIQLMQCNGSGNPGEDDFYYHNWKMKNGIKSADKKKLEGDYYSFDVDKDRAHAYIPPSFEKTLGRPTHVTASLPRQIIDIHPSQEEDCTLEC